jgi:Xaa-Pro aminopeptidase
MEERVRVVRERARQAGIDCLFLIPSANLYYFTGLEMGLSERSTVLIMPSEGETCIVAPELEALKVRQSARVDRVLSYRDEQGPSGALHDALSGIGGRRFAFEYRSMRMQEFELIKEAAGQFEYSDAGSLFASLRMVKNERELANMLKACAMVEAGMESALRAIRPDVSELEVQLAIERDLRTLGVGGAIRMSVASGPRSGLAHNGTSTRVITEGDLVWVDLMVSHDAYWADITRTFPVGQVSPELQQIYQVVLEAQQAARERARPGMTGSEIDAIARGIIESRGFGEYFTHRTGHGIGLEIHEEPYVVASAQMPLEAGMTFTIEPGVYLPGKGGVRIEDDVLLVPGGARSLTNFRRNLLTQKSRYVI